MARRHSVAIVCHSSHRRDSYAGVEIYSFISSFGAFVYADGNGRAQRPDRSTLRARGDTLMLLLLTAGILTIYMDATWELYGGEQYPTGQRH